MSGKDVVRQTLEGEPNIVEVEVEYRKGSKAKYNLLPGNSAQRQSQIDRLLSVVNWDKVEEVEIEYVDGYKEEIDLEAKPRKNKKGSESEPIVAAIADETPESATAEISADPIFPGGEQIPDPIEVIVEERAAEAAEEREAEAKESVIHYEAPILVEPEVAHQPFVAHAPIAAPTPAASPARQYPDSADQSSYSGRSRRRSKRNLRKSRKCRKTGIKKAKVRACNRVRPRKRKHGLTKKRGPLHIVKLSGVRRNNPARALLFV